MKGSWWAIAAALGGGVWFASRRRSRPEHPADARPVRSVPDPECVELTSEDSFPASDPPSWTGASASAEN